MNDEYFEQLGRLVGPYPERQVAFGCEACNGVWYGYEEIAPDGRHPRPDRYCPNCGEQRVVEIGDLPGALVMKSWVEWESDRPSMEADTTTESDASQAVQSTGRRPP